MARRKSKNKKKNSQLGFITKELSSTERWRHVLDEPGTVHERRLSTQANEKVLYTPFGGSPVLPVPYRPNDNYRRATKEETWNKPAEQNADHSLDINSETLDVNEVHHDFDNEMRSENEISDEDCRSDISMGVQSDVAAPEALTYAQAATRDDNEQIVNLKPARRRKENRLDDLYEDERGVQQLRDYHGRVILPSKDFRRRGKAERKQMRAANY